MRNMQLCSIVYFIAIITGCHKSSIIDNTGKIHLGDTATVQVSTDKAVYMPGDNVSFHLNKMLPAGTSIIYTSMDSIIAQQTLSDTAWSWTTPNRDFTGYMITLQNNGTVYGTVAVDVSSDPSRFPRNGFLSAYGQMSASQMTGQINTLSRLHINYLQFYDWQWDHECPLAGTPASPAASWLDLANRTNYMATVQGYIQASQTDNIKTLAYNLCYGALNDAASLGVSNEWYLYNDASHTSQDVFNLSAPFRSNIYITNPANTGWQNYLAGRNSDMYSVYNFDGYQIDQLGDPGKSLYDYNGNPVTLSNTFNPFINAMKTAAPTKRLVMNAVNQYGQQGIATAPTDFLYSEVWSPNDGYADLAKIIQDNNNFSSNQKSTVLAAYMDYNLGNNTGFFNTPGVLMTDAVIFAFGGAHLEMGEHMLCKEYFPNNNLIMHNDLQQAMIHYYDFLTGYENLLRGGGTFNSPVLSCTNGMMQINNWPPQQGAVSVVGKDMGTKQVLHLINFKNATSLLWRDADGTQPAADIIQNATLNFTSSKAVKKLWYASPDVNFGAPQELTFSQSGNTLTFTLPSLQYWDMVVVEYN